MSILNFWTSSHKGNPELRKFLNTHFDIKPKNLRYYAKAFRHKSSLEDKNISASNERLEFLGDAILNAIAADFFYTNLPEGDEGRLTTLRAHVVNRTFLNKIALQFNIDKHLKKNIDHDLTNSSIYGNALEALFGAMYLDLGYKKTKKIIVEKIFSLVPERIALIDLPVNNKSKILEWCQANKLDFKYDVRQNEDENAEHNFTAVLEIKEKGAFFGHGHNKKAAQAAAAGNAIQALSIK